MTTVFTGNLTQVEQEFYTHRKRLEKSKELLPVTGDFRENEETDRFIKNMTIALVVEDESEEIV